MAPGLGFAAFSIPCLALFIQIAVGIALIFVGASKVDDDTCSINVLPVLLIVLGAVAIASILPCLTFLLFGMLLLASHIVFGNHTYMKAAENIVALKSGKAGIQGLRIAQAGQGYTECDRELLGVGVICVIILWNTLAIILFSMLLASGRIGERITYYRSRLPGWLCGTGGEKDSCDERSKKRSVICKDDDIPDPAAFIALPNAKETRETDKCRGDDTSIKSLDSLSNELVQAKPCEIENKSSARVIMEQCEKTVTSDKIDKCGKKMSEKDEGSTRSNSFTIEETDQSRHHINFFRQSVESCNPTSMTPHIQVAPNLSYSATKPEEKDNQDCHYHITPGYICKPCRSGEKIQTHQDHQGQHTHTDGCEPQTLSRQERRGQSIHIHYYEPQTQTRQKHQGQRTHALYCEPQYSKQRAHIIRK